MRAINLAQHTPEASWVPQLFADTDKMLPIPMAVCIRGEYLVSLASLQPIECW